MTSLSDVSPAFCRQFIPASPWTKCRLWHTVTWHWISTNQSNQRIRGNHWLTWNYWRGLSIKYENSILSIKNVFSTTDFHIVHLQQYHRMLSLIAAHSRSCIHCNSSKRIHFDAITHSLQRIRWRPYIIGYVNWMHNEFVTMKSLAFIYIHVRIHVNTFAKIAGLRLSQTVCFRSISY